MKKCMSESKETPMSEAKSHSEGFLKKAVKKSEKMSKSSMRRTK